MYPVPRDESKLKEEPVYGNPRSKPIQQRMEVSGNDATATATHIGARLKNPLAGVPRETLMSDVEEFARQKNLEHVLPQLKKGALLAQNPHDYDNMPELTQEVCGEICLIRHAVCLKLAAGETLPRSRAYTPLASPNYSLPYYRSVLHRCCRSRYFNICSGARNLADTCCAQDGIRQAQTEPIFHSLKSLVLALIKG